MKKWMLIIAVVAGLAGVGIADTVVLRNGKVIEGRVIHTNAVSVTVRTATGVQTYYLNELQNNAEDARAAVWSARSPAVDTPPASAKNAGHRNPDENPGKFFLRGCLSIRAGQILWILGSVLLLVQGFRTSILWGVLVLFTNLLGAIIFLVFHPKRAIVPLLIMLVGIVVFAMAPFWALWGAGLK